MNCWEMWEWSKEKSIHCLVRFKVFSVGDGSLRGGVSYYQIHDSHGEDFCDRWMPAGGSGFETWVCTNLVLIASYLRNSLLLRVVKGKGHIVGYCSWE